MPRLLLFRAVLFAALGVAPMPTLAPAATIHLVIVADTLDAKIGKNVAADLDDVEWAFRANVPEETGILSVIRLEGDRCRPDAILAAVRDLPAGLDDAVVVSYHGHGAYDPQAGAYLSFPRLGAHLTRAELTAAVRARATRLVVIATDCCNTLSMLRRKQVPMPSQAPQMRGAPQVSPLFRSLFLDVSGFVDLNSSKRDEQAISYPATRDQQGIETFRGGLFTEAVTGLFRRASARVMTWDDFAARVAEDVRDAFGKLKPDGLDNPDAPEAPQMTQTVVAAIDVRTVRPTVVDPGLPVNPPPFDPDDLKAPSQSLGVLGVENDGRGITVWSTRPGSPAAQLGFERGDVIVAVNDNRVRTARGFQQSLVRAPGAVTLAFINVRTGLEQAVSVDLANLGTRGGHYQARPGEPSTFGASVAAVPGGVQVVSVVPGSPAALLQLDPGDLITSVNGRPVADDPGFRAAIASSPDEMWLELVNVRTRKTQGFVATLDRRPVEGFDRVVPVPVPGANPVFGIHGFDNGGSGVYLWSTRPGSPAAQLGLERSDLLLTIDGRELRGVDDYRAALWASGGHVALTVRDWRTGQVRQAQADLIMRPPPPVNPDPRAVFGILGAAAPEGVRVQSVVAGSAASFAGVDVGDVIVSINGVPVRTPDESIRAIRASPDEMVFTVRNVRTGQLLRMVTTLDR